MARLDGNKSNSTPWVIGLLVLAVLVVGAYFLLFNRDTRVADVDADVDIERVDRSATEENAEVDTNADATAAPADNAGTPPTANATGSNPGDGSAVTDAGPGTATAGNPPANTATATAPAGNAATAGAPATGTGTTGTGTAGTGGNPATAAPPAAR